LDQLFAFIGAQLNEELLGGGESGDRFIAITKATEGIWVNRKRWRKGVE